MKISTIRLTRDSALACALIPYALHRVHQFCLRFDTDTDGVELVEMIWRLFASGDNRLGFWIAYDSQFRVIAHLLATPEPVELAKGWSYALIRQAEVDRTVLMDTARVMDEVKEWARNLGCTRLKLLTHRLPKALMRRWGARLTKHLMEISLIESAREKKNSPLARSDDTTQSGGEETYGGASN